MVKNESGFSLIEIIVVLVLIGIVATIAAMGFVTGIKGYIFANEMASTAQNANLATSRLTRELMEISTVTSASPTAISFSNIYGNRAIYLVGNQIEINETGIIPTSEGTGYTLINNVNSFTLTYLDGAASWVCCSANTLSSINVDLVVDSTDGGGGTITFSTVINPRNAGNYNAPII